MDGGHFIRPSVLKSLAKNKNFKLKHLLGSGNFPKGLLLEDVFTQQEAIGKIVSIQNEGEFRYWPSLRHESLIPLLGIVTIDERMSLFVCPYMRICLGLLIEEASFLQHPKCFDRKKSYTKNVLSGLEYLHQLSLSLLNLSHQNILICGKSDRALVTDFSCSVSAKSTTRLKSSLSQIQCLPPEMTQLEDDETTIECTPVDVWLCGVMVLQIFTRHVLPRIDDVNDSLNELSIEVLRQANSGSYLSEDAAICLREFLEPFLQQDPESRIIAKEASALSFLQSSPRLDEQARCFWKLKDTSESLVKAKAKKSNVPLKECGQRRHVHTIRDGKNFESETKVKALKNVCAENRICKKAKSELYTEKNSQSVEGRIQSHKSITFLNYMCENRAQRHGSVSEDSVEPHLFKDSTKFLFSNDFEPFPCFFRKGVFNERMKGFNLRKEKDPWRENEGLYAPPNDDISEVEEHFKNLESPDATESRCSGISHVPCSSYTENIYDVIIKTTPPVTRMELISDQCYEQLPSAMTLAEDFPNMTNNSCEPCAYNAIANLKAQSEDHRCFLNDPWQPNSVGRMPLVRGKRNLYRCKMGTRLRNPFSGRNNTPRLMELPPSTIQDIFSHDQLTEKDINALEFLLDGMLCCDLGLSANTRNKKSDALEGKKMAMRLREKILAHGTPARNATVQNDEVDIPLELPLCSRVQDVDTIKIIQKDLFKKKPKQRFLRMLCPGSKWKGKSSNTFSSDGQNLTEVD